MGKDFIEIVLFKAVFDKSLRYLTP